MIVGIGLDLIETSRVARALQRWGDLVLCEFRLIGEPPQTGGRPAGR